MTDHVDLLALILSFLNRKIKYRMRETCRDFRDHVVPRSMVSLSFKTMNPFKEFTFNEKKDTFFASSIKSCLNVSKLELEDQLILDLEISKQIGQTLQENEQFC